MKYNFLDLIGELGGVKEMLVVLVAIFIAPMTNHSFIIKAASKMFYARTYSNKLFIPTKD